MIGIFAAAAQCLCATCPEDKVRLTRAAAAEFRAGRILLEDEDGPGPIGEPGRPARPALVAPRQLPRRSFHSLDGRAALIHAVAHIEFNAINLAWDAVYRFRELPPAYYDDWVRVADEEAGHFFLLQARLRVLGYEYGAFPAHDGLWQMARDTAHDPLVRMALVPRVLEARGLDVTPGMIERLATAGDTDTAAVLTIILRDEIGHVAIGSRWFRFLCEQRGLVPEPTFRSLIQRYLKGPLKGPFHREARRRAGFSESELLLLDELQAVDDGATRPVSAG